MRIRTLFAFALVVLTMVSTRSASAQLIESWENSADGWVTTSENPTYVIGGFSTTTGVTDQAYSMSVTGSAGPGYGQMLRGPNSLFNTQTLANASSVKVDVLADPSFGFQQWTLVVNGGTLGYHSVDGFSFSQSPVLGTESTLTWNISAADRAAYAADALLGTQVQLIFQVGGGSGGTMNVDNLRAVPAPEPSIAGLMGLGAIGSMLRRRR